MVYGAKVLRDLIAEAEEDGCELVKLDMRLWDEEYETYYHPEYLKKGELEVQLPPTNDHDVIVGPEVVQYVWTHLEMEHKISR